MLENIRATEEIVGVTEEISKEIKVEKTPEYFNKGDICLVKDGTNKRGWARAMEKLIFRPVVVVEVLSRNNRYKCKYSTKNDVGLNVNTLNSFGSAASAEWVFYREDLELYKGSITSEELKRKRIIELVGEIDKLQSKVK